MSIPWGNNIVLTLRGQEVFIDEVQLQAPEPDVGLMGWSLDGWKIFDASDESAGNELDWELTVEENNQIVNALVEALKDYNGPDYGDDFDDFDDLGGLYTEE